MSVLPAPGELKKHIPLKQSQYDFIAFSRKKIQFILDGKDPAILLILGPCSIHDLTSAEEYAFRLKDLSTKVSDSFFPVMRTYFEKPRTRMGWKGFVNDPALDGTGDISKGLYLSRQLLSKISDMEIPCATEFLDPLVCPYIQEFISWGSIGARTISSQIHRQLASSLEMPIGMKNNTDGNIKVAIEAIHSAQSEHHFLTIDDCGRLKLGKGAGNKSPHLVLRGGKEATNYDPVSLSSALRTLEEYQLPASFLVDCSHDNSEKKFQKQISVFQSVFHQMIEGNRNIRGMMLESNLLSGNQSLTSNPSDLQYGVSITDPCLDWQSTEHLILWAHEKVQATVFQKL